MASSEILGCSSSVGFKTSTSFPESLSILNPLFDRVGEAPGDESVDYRTLGAVSILSEDDGIGELVLLPLLLVGGIC